MSKLPLAVADFDFTSTIHCDSATFYFNNKSIDGDIFLWDFGESQTDTAANPVHTYYSSGIYTVSLTATDTILMTDSTVTAIINLTINKVDATVTQSDNSLTADEADASYQWIDCNDNYNIIPGAVSQAFIAESSGSYAVIVTKNGCTDTSVCIVVTGVNIIENTLNNNLKVFPNPTTGKIRVDFGETLINFTSYLRDMDGKLIKITDHTETRIMELDIDGPPGIYLLDIISTDNRRSTVKIIKH